MTWEQVLCECMGLCECWVLSKRAAKAYYIHTDLVHAWPCTVFKKQTHTHTHTNLHEEDRCLLAEGALLCRQRGSRALGHECINQSWLLTFEARRRGLGETAWLLIQRRSHTQLLMSQKATVMEYMIISRLARSLFSSSKSCSRRFSLMICTDKWKNRSQQQIINRRKTE